MLHNAYCVAHTNNKCSSSLFVFGFLFFSLALFLFLFCMYSVSLNSFWEVVLFGRKFQSMTLKEHVSIFMRNTCFYCRCVVAKIMFKSMLKPHLPTTNTSIKSWIFCTQVSIMRILTDLFVYISWCVCVCVRLLWLNYISFLTMFHRFNYLLFFGLVKSSFLVRSHISHQYHCWWWVMTITNDFGRSKNCSFRVDEHEQKK